MGKIILIGGAPTVGKSYIARKLAEDLKLPWISTDTIREQMRQLVRVEDYPILFDHQEPTSDKAVEYLTQNTAQEIIKHHNQENTEVWKGVKALIDTDYVWESFIIEGIAVLPELVSQDYSKNPDIQAVFLVDEDIKRVRHIIHTRGLWDDADKYPDSVKEKEVQWVMEFNKWLISECTKYNFPIIRRKDDDVYFEEIKSQISRI